MFTFSFGSAFGADGDAGSTTPTPAQQHETFLDETFNSNISDQYFEDLWAGFVKVVAGDNGDVIEIAYGSATPATKYAVKKSVVAGLKAEAKAAYDEYMKKEATGYVTSAGDFATVLLGNLDKAKEFKLAAAKGQFAADKAEALANLGTVPTYSYSTEVMSKTDAETAQVLTTNTAGVAKVKFVDKDYTYQKAAELLVEYYKGEVEDIDDFTLDVTVAQLAEASSNVANVIATALYPICVETATKTGISTGTYDLQVGYAADVVVSGEGVTVDGVAGSYVKSDTTNAWSAKGIEAGNKTEAASIAAVKAQIAATYASKSINATTKEMKYLDKWLKVANILAEEGYGQPNRPEIEEPSYDSANDTGVYADKADKIADLEDVAAKWGAEKDANGDLVRDAAKVKKALEKGIVAIATAKATEASGSTAAVTEKEAVEKAYAAAEKEIKENAISKVAADKFAFVKDSAKKAMELFVSDAVEDETYYEAELNEVKKYAEKYTAKVDAAEDQKDVEQAYGEFLAKVEVVKTAKALASEYKNAMTDEGTNAVSVLYKTAKAYVTFADSDSTKEAGEMLDDSTLKARLADMVGKSGVRTEKEIKALKDEAAKVAQGLPTVDAVKAAKKALKTAVEALPVKVTVADLAAVQAASDAVAAYADLTANYKNDVPAAYNAAIAALINSYNAQFAQQAAKIAKTDEAAIKDIDAAIDTLDALKDAFADDDTRAAKIQFMTDLKATLEGYLGDIKTTEENAVKAAINAIPLKVTETDKATVEKARKLYDEFVAKYNNYEALYETVGTPVSADYTKGYAAFDITELTDAEAVLGLNAVSPAELVKGLKITAKSTAKKGSITVKWTVKGEADIDGYEIWKSTKANKGYKKAFTTTKKTYKNSKGLKKGTRYYYKVRAYKVIDGVKVTSDWSNKANRKAK